MKGSKTPFFFGSLSPLVFTPFCLLLLSSAPLFSSDPVELNLMPGIYVKPLVEKHGRTLKEGG